ncbi:FAD-dependent pyridine nucleotide-disulfide oxidoreductase [Viridothelium virens]|uniref:FAD-dependent pyridine nucleotide-disulfide oxidoreductase n=1 Tax=Viridothelium virens TaxID=1048519 RepID=A0A6A6HNL3_VIRVR|nr:FAD-dependent pyridine nucleotide-disulfide oxidoreductase [Viridothelium virens]
MPPYNSINLHPSSFGPSDLSLHTYDVIFIGSGWPANVGAARVTQAGMKPVIVESELIGGDCPYWACIPSKALLRPGEALQDAKSVPGIAITNGLDADAVFRGRDSWTGDWDDQVLIPSIGGDDADFVRGHGKVVGVKKVRVENTNGESVTLEARQAVVICTGSEPVIPNIPGLADANPWIPRQATSTSQVPKNLVILGAGAVGCEMATIFANLGGKVSLISSTKELLPRTDPEAGALVRQSLVDLGVEMYLSAEVTGVQRKRDGTLEVQLKHGSVIHATEILISTGRRPRVKDIGLEQLGIAVNGSRIPVDESLCVGLESGEWLYAAGDVNGRAMMSHTAKYHARVVVNAIIARKTGAKPTITEWGSLSATADKYAVPQVVFTRPTVASVGLTRQAAEAAGRSFREVTAPLKTEGAELRAIGYKDGWAQWIVDAESGQLLGATFVGDDAADLLHASTVAIVGGLTIARLAHAIPSFPTMSEVYLNLIEAAGF